MRWFVRLSLILVVIVLSACASSRSSKVLNSQPGEQRQVPDLSGSDWKVVASGLSGAWVVLDGDKKVEIPLIVTFCRNRYDNTNVFIYSWPKNYYVFLMMYGHPTKHGSDARMAIYHSGQWHAAKEKGSSAAKAYLIRRKTDGKPVGATFLLDTFDGMKELNFAFD